MTLIEALQKWDKVTNDGGKTIYSTNSDWNNSYAY